MISKRSHLFRNTVLLLALLFLLAEILLRIVFAVKSYPVDSLAPSWLAVQQVDSLENRQSYYTDNKGIYKALPDFWNKMGVPINSDGFRGREFIPDTLNDSSVSILFIGDSFVWGAHATPPDSCFVDLLDHDDKIVCFNAGIPGTDPAQYLAVADEYVPKIHPVFTVVMIYIGNDLMSESRKLIPNEQMWFQTNAGWLPASYKGIRFSSAQESYNYIARKYAPKNFWQKIVLKTAIGTAILSLPYRLEEYSEWNKKRESPVTNDYLKQIKSVCEKNNSRLLVFVIPSAQTDLTKEFFKDSKSYIHNQYPLLMQGLEEITFALPVKKYFYYAPPDGHLNNKGHLATAEFIRSKIISTTPP